MQNKYLSIYLVIWIFFNIFFLPFIDAREAAVKNDHAFYAISSLKFFLEKNLSNEPIEPDSIHFSETDIAYLWFLASSEPSIVNQVEEAQSWYYEALNQAAHSPLFIEQCRKSQMILDTLWQDLNPYIAREHSIFNALKERSILSQVARSRKGYPNFDDNSFITKTMRKKMRPYLLPLESKLRPPLEAIFGSSRVIWDETSFVNAGFMTIAHQISKSLIRVAYHPAISGYLFKVYLDSDSDKLKITKEAGWMRLKCRCQGAENIRILIKDKKLKHFSVPDKWLYPLSVSQIPSTTSNESIQPVILIVTDMQIMSPEDSQEAWKTKVTPSHLDELYCIFSHGYASTFLAFNIPYTINGKFACIDTEYPERKLNYDSVTKYLSPEMQIYWEKLVKRGGNPKYRF